MSRHYNQLLDRRKRLVVEFYASLLGVVSADIVEDWLEENNPYMRQTLMVSIMSAQNLKLLIIHCINKDNISDDYKK
ncbi:MAG: hypothetical protein J0H92_07870 [Sphingobacteriales bacterium]|nr:hypothetical protein [Sphingobacteriales bacterium]OJW30089.1 MAG: hypothetical protein BGO54_00390 [Sphingobacteriales bacterium 46-32]